MRVRPGESSQLISGFQRDANSGCPAELNQSLQPIIATFPGHADMVKWPRTRTDGLLNRVETV
jgi:hypothetical protein